uniref:Major facilitator superfamily (MFS) profile domain-containing protein n=1 Tax=Setaria digitata TaxID=48799 RepID=A0A915Q0L2_9BILA
MPVFGDEISSHSIFESNVAYESPRWLIQKGRIDEAYDVLKSITRWNGRSDVTKDMIDEVIGAEKQILRERISSRKNYYIYHLFHTRQLTTYAIVLSYSLYAVNIASALTDYTQNWFGRRMAHTIALALTTIGFVINFIITCSGFSTKLEIISRIATLTAFAMMSQVYIVTGMSGNELFPTVLRSMCFSFLQVVGRIGVVLAPQLFFLANYWTPAPIVALILFALSDLLLYLIFIPETKGRPLPDRLPTATNAPSSQLLPELSAKS